MAEIDTDDQRALSLVLSHHLTTSQPPNVRSILSFPLITAQTIATHTALLFT